MSNISEFFDQKVVLITGSSGFVGKCLLEKILRSTHVTQVYCLLRPKTGKTAERRLQELLKESLFSKLTPNQLSKALAICGDVTLPEMGLNPLERESLSENVQIVFNCAATIRFDEPIRSDICAN